MFYRSFLVIALLVAVSGLLTSPAAAQGEIIITQAKANAGGVTPGDGPGFRLRFRCQGPMFLGAISTLRRAKTASLSKATMSIST